MNSDYKIHSHQKTNVMCRYFLIAFLFAASFKAFAQPVSVDLSLSNNQIVNAMGGDVDANLLTIGQVVRIKVVIGNFVSGVVAPAGHFRIRIGLGNGLILNPGFNIATAPLSAYFNWSYDLSGSQPQIVGNSIADLPDGFAEFADFEAKAVNSTTSTVSFNFLISNPPGTTTPVSDPSPANNSASNTYSVTAGGALPVTFTHINAVKKGCDINVLWEVANQLNLKKYEIEASKDNATFTKVGEIAAKNNPDYAVPFTLNDQLKATTIFIRLKSIDLDGTYRYSKTISVGGTCDVAWQLMVFPNPATDVSNVTIATKQGIFNGKYKISISSMNGQLLQQKELELSNTKTFPLYVKGLISGKYHIKISNADGSESTVLDFEKL